MTTLFIVLLVLASSAALVAQLVWWLSGRQDSERVPPPLVVPIHPRFIRQAEESGATAARTIPEVVVSDPIVPTPVALTAVQPTPVQPVPVVSLDASPAQPALPVPAEVPNTETVRFVRPSDEALQLLPARLEVVSGMTPQQVIRFVRVPGKPAEMILGRDAASSPQHVMLTSSTVSRRHARVLYDNGRWLVTNLSRTNPVVVNDQALNEFEGARPLLDGDRIELGDVVLRFCTS